MTEHEQSSIIGYWRSGSTIEEIALITGLFQSEIKKVIEEYKKKINPC